MPEYRYIPMDAFCYSNIASQGDRTLCVTIPEMVKCGLSDNYIYRSLNGQRNGELFCWPHHKEGNTVYIHYSGLKSHYQETIKTKLMSGMDPDKWYDAYGRVEAIENRLSNYSDLKVQDECFLDEATYPNGDKLSPKAHHEAAEACRWLGVLVSLKKKKDVIASGYDSVQKLYDDVIFLIGRLGVKLPKSYTKLRARVRLYEQNGAASCVDMRSQGNKAAAKIYSEEQTALLCSICGRGANYNGQQIADLYNIVADKKGWDLISRRSALNYMKQYNLVVEAGRNGSEAFRNKIGMQIRRQRPTEAMSFWSIDGWTAELYYQKDVKDGSGKTVHTYMNRMTVVVVIDATNDYPVGYAIGECESVKLIQAAVKNAIDYVSDELGGSYRPYQIQSDHYGIKSMSTIYDNLCEYFTPARVKNAKSKPIERYFLGLNRKCQLYFGNYNWSGFGITSKKQHQPNIDILNYNKNKFPDKDQVCQQIHFIINKERADKKEMWLKAWHRMPETDRLTLTRENYLLNFGMRNDRTIRINAGCLEPTILGEKRSYDSFDMEFRKNPLQSWTVMYDEKDLSTILVTDETQKTRFLLNAVHTQPMALRDRKPGDDEARRKVDAFNKNVLEPYVIGKVTGYEKTAMALVSQSRELEGWREATMLTDGRGQHKAYLQHASLIKSESDLQPEIEEKTSFKSSDKQRKNDAKTEAEQKEAAYIEYRNSVIDIDKFRES